jgi:hypothetical protein
MQEIAITKPYRHLKWDISESAMKTAKPKSEALQRPCGAELKRDWLEKPDLPQTPRSEWALSMEKSSLS